jgi:outer membrane lipoprotein-sorting protein
MTSKCRRRFFGAAAVTLLAFGAAVAAQQAPLAQPPVAEAVFKNIQVMKGVPVDEFMGSMGFISNALAVNCTYCHLGEGGGGWAEYARDNDKKQRARQMILMVNALNRANFGGRRVVTCVTCHNGANRPKVTRDLNVVYSLPMGDEPETIAAQAPGAPSAEQVLDKYIQAVGGPARLAAMTSFVARGEYLGYGEAQAVPVEIYAKAPSQLTTIIRTLNGASTATYDGAAGWMAVPDAETPIPLRALNGTELEGARLDAQLAFPAAIKQALTDWRGAIPSALGDRDVVVIQGTSASGSPVKLYFDEETGLLVRYVRYTEAALGRNMFQVDYDNYRDVAGVKIPFNRTVTWQSGQGKYDLKDVQPNAAIDAARFARPAAPAAPAR